MPEKVSDPTICSRCGLIGSRELHKCSQCHSIAYCDEDCKREDWGRHKDNCIPVMVTEVTGKGRGIVASRDIQIGQVIFTEQSSGRLSSSQEKSPNKMSSHIFYHDQIGVKRKQRQQERGQSPGVQLSLI